VSGQKLDKGIAIVAVAIPVVSCIAVIIVAVSTR
jgi:hypothetical protein